MARLILQTVLLVTIISALHGAPQNPTTPRHDAVPAIAILDAKPNAQHSTSSEEAKIRPARTPDHDGTDHDHKHEHPADIAKSDEHTDHGSSTTPKTRPARDTEEEEKKKHSHEHAPLLTNLKDEVTSAKPRTARAAEKDEKHEDSHEHNHPASLTKDSHEHKKEEEQTRPARATEEEKKSGVHDQPIPIPPTLKETHHEAHPEEKKETPKQKREADEKDSHEVHSDEKDSDSKEDDSQSAESPLTYTKVISEQHEGDAHFELPNKESEYDRHTRQSNDDHHGHTKDIVTPEHSHSKLNTQHIHDDSDSNSSSSEENKSKSS